MEIFQGGMMIDFNAAIRPDETVVTKEQQEQLGRILKDRLTPVVHDPFDLAPVKKKLEPYERQIDEMLKQAEAITVTDDKTARASTVLAGKFRKVQKGVESLRKEITGPAFDFKRSVDALANGFMEKCKAGADDLGRKISQHQAKVELERRKAEESARKVAAELQKKLDAEARAADVEPVKVEAPVIRKAPTKVRTEEATSYQHTEWTHEIEDPDKVPREYLMVDEKEIRKAVKAGVREIPGVKIFEKTTTRFRT